jgi:MSHA type pilus biogenesis protein MshL
MATVGTIRGKNKAMRSVAESEGSNSAAVSRRRDTALLKSRLYSLRKRVVPLALALIIAGCSAYRPYIPTSEGHIDKPKAQPDRAIPPPARVTTFVPPPKPTVKPQTYTVVVNEVPVKDLLLALARDTKQNIDIHPGITGLVSLNAVNETLPAILNRVAKQVNMRYRVEGNTIIVSPDVPYVKTYRVPYVDMLRNSSSAIGVSGQISTSATQGGASSGGDAGSASSTLVTTKMTNDFYGTLRDNIRNILRTMRTQSLSAEEQQRRREDQKLALDLERERLRATANAAIAASNSRGSLGSGATADLIRAASATPVSVGRVEDDVIVNALSGTLTVSATEREHQVIQQHIDSVLRSVQRQVLIEATIVEVQLSNDYQAGVDWSRVAADGGIVFSTLGQLAGFGANPITGNTFANIFAATYTNGNPDTGQVQLTVKLLEQFGNTRVLSSPKLMALNNQTALLKVVDNVVYFEVKSQTSQAQTTALTTFDTTAKTVAVGVVMGVTPQINDDGRVSLTVRPTISRVIKFVNDPNPSLAAAGVQNPVPQVQTREMESVLQVANGQVVILGGLMQDDVRRTRDQVPFVGNVPDVGEAFALRKEAVAKTELIIFLRTTIVPNPTLESDELKFFQRFLPKPETPPDLSSVPKDLRPPPGDILPKSEPAGAAQ